jgi:hypothetical protein
LGQGVSFVLAVPQVASFGAGRKRLLACKVWGGRGGRASDVDFSKARKGLQAQKPIFYNPKICLVPPKRLWESPRGAEVPEWGHRWACLYICLKSKPFDCPSLTGLFLTLYLALLCAVAGAGGSGCVWVGGCGIMGVWPGIG